VVAGSTTMQRVVEWADAEEDVRAAFLIGSRGEFDRQPDRLSDYDVLLFVRNRSMYESDDSWLTAFGTILVKFHDVYELLGSRIVTRLVQYQEGTRIDFSILDVGLLERITEEPKLPDMLDAGFRVLVDKDDWASRTPGATGEAYRGSLPSETTYQAVVNEFWWEVVYVAKHLARGELLPALYSQECVIRFQCLVPMLEWYARAVHGAESPIGPHGRGLVRELEATEVDRLNRTFLGSSVEEGWEGLFETTAYFRVISTAVAERLGFTVQDELSNGVESLLRDMREEHAEGR
jgi:aminoglycoside 6-adenylyltransferase